MYIIHRKENKITQIDKTSFHDLKYSERANLQEWIANNPGCLSVDDSKKNDENEDPLLIIQKEFAGFSDTKERLDLLALDQTGALVVIENKLDNSGHDVTWQALKYASYCFTMKAEQIKEIYQAYLDKVQPSSNAEEKITEFYGNKPFDEIPLNVPDLRIILVASNFRKEVTSTVLWLRDKYGLRIQCIRVTPYKIDEQELLDIEQIIPIREAEDYMIHRAEKEREITEKQVAMQDISKLRKRFWSVLLNRYRINDHHFDNVNPTTDHWLGSGSGVSGCSFNFIATTFYAGIELAISCADQMCNKKIFDTLFQQKEELERKFGGELDWQRLDDKIMSRIGCQIREVSIKDEDTWERMMAFLCDMMPRLIEAFQNPLKNAAHKK